MFDYVKILKIIIPPLFFLLAILFWAPVVSASTNISATTNAHWAWNDIIGWIDFYNTLTITVSSTALQGYASSSAGDISLDCATTRNGNICGTSSYQITNDRAGNLSGWAWNDQYGWISFSCNNNGSCGSSNYGAYINGATGDFENYAWNDTIGWISFNCNNYAGGCSSNYEINTSWLATSTVGILDSSIFDTGISTGAQLNSVMWHGSQPVGTSVWFQFAVATSSAPSQWTFVGTDGTSNTYYNSSGPDVSLKLSYSPHNNYRYFRYRAYLFSNTASTVSPRVDDIIVNWSP